MVRLSSDGSISTFIYSKDRVEDMVLYLGGNNAGSVSSIDTLNINQIKVLLFGSDITTSLNDSDTFLVNTANGVFTIRKSVLMFLILGSDQNYA